MERSPGAGFLFLLHSSVQAYNPGHKYLQPGKRQEELP